MSISIELYRIRIGNFESNKPRKMKCKKLRSGKYSNITILIFSILNTRFCLEDEAEAFKMTSSLDYFTKLVASI